MSDERKDMKVPPGGFSNFRDKLEVEGRVGALPRRGRRGPSEPPERHPAGDRPNVLWLMADQLRGDTLGCAGHPVVKTPNIDRLASEGAIFTNTFCAAPVCVPSRASMLTGRHLFGHGAVSNRHRMRGGQVRFPELVRGAGWRTANVGKHHAGCSSQEVWEEQITVEDRFGATKPSSVPFDPKNFPGVTFIANEVCDNANRILHGKYPARVNLTKSFILSSQGIDWLRWNDDPRPFFLRVSYDDPHPPIIPPEPFHSMYGPEDVPEGIWSEQDASIRSKPATVADWRRYQHQDGISLEDHRKHAAAYFGLVSHLDAQIGRVLEYLDETGLAENTIVILNSDHGHMIGEHGLAHKGPYCYEGTLHIPTIIRWPGHIEPGTRVDALTHGVDLMPTVMDLLDLEAPDGLHGRSLAPLLAGDGEEREYVFSQWEDYVFCVRGRRWKLTWYESDQTGELYDLEADPYEKENLYGEEDHREVREELMGVLRDWRDQYARREELPGVE
ncbi:MAG: sulfatase-like hydrolase/transferase [Candidatus Brocadiia bacterium]